MLTKVVKFFFSGLFNLIASLSSIIGLILILFTNLNALIIALICFIVFLVIILIRIYALFKTFILAKTENGEHKFATYVRYSTEDGKHIVYELHKYIQCKKLIIDEHVHDFAWSGSEPPIITSCLQEFKEFVKMPKGQYDKAIFRFRKPLTYNQFTIVHIKMALDDEDDKSKPFCEQSVKEEIQLINFRIELRHLTNNEDAQISKRRIKSDLLQDEEHLDWIHFDKQSKSFEYTIFNPEVGYAYKICWKKHPTPILL